LDTIYQLKNLFNCSVSDANFQYLGALIRSRPLASDFHPLLSKVFAMLSTWKSRYISMPGRIILVKSCLSALPQYLFWATYIPNSIIEKMESFIKSFV